ncbi:MAG: type II secretion system F family protein [Anaerolineae bacterium]|nr:type II secretion system F family protein [Anaerolineae bacterium]
MENTALASLVVAGLTLAGVLAIFAGVYVLVERPDDVRLRLQAFAGAAEEERQARRRGPALKALLAGLDRFFSGQSFAQRLALNLAQANVHMTVPEFMLLPIVAAGLGSLLAYLLQGYAISAVAGGAFGFAVPWLFLEWRRRRRLSAFQAQLLDVLSLVTGSLKAGHGLLNAFNVVCKELDPPASEEFLRVVREIGYGLSQTQALNNLVKRVESSDLELIVTAVNVSHDVGGNLALVLEKIAETIRERIRLQGEIRVLTTQQRLTTYLLVALPVVLGGVLALINPTWMMRLFQPGYVRIIPISAATLEVLGFLAARRVARIEV